MNKSKKTKWEAELEALKKIQVHFDFQQALRKKIRMEAAEEDMNPSDVIRKIVGLYFSKIQRPRIGLSFNPDDLSYLAERYNLDPSDATAVKKQVLREIESHYNDE
jgi:transcriptional regulator of nitric oxide reductase